MYDIAWAPSQEGDAEAKLGTVDEAGSGSGAATHVMTASADGVARAWSVGGEGSVGSGAGDVVAQHACECYAAAWHPAGGLLRTST